MNISYKLILYAFYDDEKISEYCDPEYADKNVKQLVYSIYRKIEEYEKWTGNSSFDKLVIDGETVGYVFCYENLLVSFGVNKKFRTSDKLKKVFEFIKNKFKGNFESYMWARNTRAINWLKKCGMQEEQSNINNVIKLKYICQ